MGAVVDWNYYITVYVGTEVDETSFPALSARAEDIVGAMTHWAVNDTNISTYPAMVQTLYKKAICAQVDYFALYGTEAVQGELDHGWSVGKVSVSGKMNLGGTRKGALSESISPMAKAYLEQTGLTNPQVQTAPDMPLIGWWY